MSLDGLLEAARAERDQRQASYSRRVPRASPADAEAMCIDYQCWVAIAEWLETGRFASFHGGADPERQPGTVGPDGRVDEGPPVISWPQLDAAAKAALTGAIAKIAKLEADPDQLHVEPDNRLPGVEYLEKLAALYVRRARLFHIHRQVQMRRATIDSLNAELRKPREAVAA